MEYYAAGRKKEVLPFVTAWMELESIMLSEIIQGQKTNTMGSHQWEPNKQNKLMNKTEPETWKQGTDWQWPEGRRKKDKGEKKVKEQV